MTTTANGVKASEHAGAVIALNSGRAADPAATGVKAATLARLLASGFDVPDGFVVTVEACAEARHDVPGGLRRSIASHLARLGGGPLAVRSSAVAEDLADASYAGQYESVLGVEGIDALREAVQRCIASAASERVRAYASPTDGGIAVLVQRMVQPDAAGVAFSANPVTGERDEVLVSAVRGLADRLVGGEVTPDEWVVSGEAARCVAEPQRSLTAGEAREVAGLARRLEEHFGTPQDIEWAIAGGRLHVLQSRPITALPRPPEMPAVPKGETWMKDAAHYPEPVTPFGASVYLPPLANGIMQMAAECGLMFGRVEGHCIGGEVYMHVAPFGGKEGASPPPWWLLGLLSRLVPPVRRRLGAAREAIRSGWLERLPERWDREWRDEFREAAAHMQGVDLRALSDAELEGQLDDAIALLWRGQQLHFRLFIPYVVGVAELVQTCEQSLGWTQSEALELLSGLSEASSEPSRALRRLAEQARGRPQARAALAGAGSDVQERLAEVDPELGAAFAGYLERYGQRATSYDPGSPALLERPAVLGGLLRDTIEAGGVDALERRLAEQRERAVERARAALAGRQPADRERFERVLAAAQRVYPLREDNIFWTDNVPCGLIRSIVLEIGRRLEERGVIRRAADVVQLEVDEVRGALHGDGEGARAAVGRRRAEEAWTLAHPGDAFLGQPPAALPDVRGLPEEGRRVNGAFLYFMAELFAPPAEAAGDALLGAAGSPGTYTGPVRVIRSEAEFERLRPGEVLVCPITTPVWSVLFGSVGALVTDGGGPLSHAAIVAREHGIPAVLATGSATRALRDGQIVTVDGTRGSVRASS